MSSLKWSREKKVQVLIYIHMYMYSTRKNSVRKVSNGREITFEVLRGTREMYM